MAIFLSVVIPAYNEEANLKRDVLREVSDYLQKQKYTWEVLVSDDGSTDQSRVVAKEQVKNLKGFTLLQNKHGGKPAALLSGINASHGKYILFTDMDQSTPISELKKLVTKLDEKTKVVIGSRGLVRENFPIYRRLGSIIFATVRRAMILRGITDTQCGFKLFEGKALKKAFPKLDFFKNSDKVIGWKVTSYDVELLHILEKMGCSIAEVTVNWNDQDISESKGGALQKYIIESQEMFLQIFKVRVNDLRGRYNIK